MYGGKVSNQIKMVLNKDNLNYYLNEKNMRYMDLWRELQNYGVRIEYSSLHSLIQGHVSTWNAIYVLLITEILNVNIRDIFDIVKVD